MGQRLYTLLYTSGPHNFTLYKIPTSVKKEESWTRRRLESDSIVSEGRYPETIRRWATRVGDLLSTCRVSESSRFRTVDGAFILRPRSNDILFMISMETLEEMSVVFCGKGETK